MQPEIRLHSRYGEDNRLIRLPNEQLKFQLKAEYNTWRAGIIEDNADQYTFIDPPGGPFISVGDTIEGHKVKAIYAGGIIEFEP